MTGANDNRRTLEQRANEAWDDYCKKVEATHADMTFEKAAAAGKAWARFLDLFVQIEHLDGART